jgi:hypothetical protein
MEVTCWRCRAIFDPEATGKRCPHCGCHSEAWLAKLRFAAIDFIGPITLLGLGLYQLRDDTAFSIMFLVGSLIWAGFIYFQDTGDWIVTPATDLNLVESRPVPESPILSKPPMPDSWKRFASTPRELESSILGPSSLRAPGLTWAEQLLITALICGTAIYAASRWRQIEDLVLHGNVSLAPFISPTVILCILVYAIRRTHADERILRDGALTVGVITDCYDKSTLSRFGSQHYPRIRYQFWTESGQKFEGSGTLTSGFPSPSLSIQQEPLKVFYLPQDPTKNVALCCTTSRVRVD